MTRQFLGLRLVAILSLIVAQAVIAANVVFEVQTFNAYCMQKGSDVLATGLANPISWAPIVTWLIITALPCLLVRRRGSLISFIVIVWIFAAICLACLPVAFDAPIECVTVDNHYPDNGFDFFAGATSVVITIVFLVIFIFDLIAWLWNRVAYGD